MITEAQLLKMPEKDYMNAEQLAFFKARLESERDETNATLEQTKKLMKETASTADISDWATIEEDRQKNLRTLERNNGKLRKIQKALDLISADEYGWCEDTGAPIGLPRLLSRPTATLCIEAKQAREAREKHMVTHRGAA